MANVAEIMHDDVQSARRTIATFPTYAEVLGWNLNLQPAMMQLKTGTILAPVQQQ